MGKIVGLTFKPPKGGKPKEDKPKGKDKEPDVKPDDKGENGEGADDAGKAEA